MRERTGQLFLNEKSGKWVARVGYTNLNGKRTAIQRQLDSRIEAKRILKELIEKLDQGGRRAIEIERMTFNNLADYYEEHYAKPAKFIDNRKSKV